MQEKLSGGKFASTIAVGGLGSNFNNTFNQPQKHRTLIGTLAINNNY